MPQLSMCSPVGDLTISEESDVVVSVDWGRGAEQTETPLLLDVIHQLQAYFDGQSPTFDVPIAPASTSFQQAVRNQMKEIPPGSVETYSSIAAKLGSAPRAIGMACGRNPLPIIVPCHRVVGATKSLTGYSGDGGLETKAYLLRLEGYDLDNWRLA